MGKTKLYKESYRLARRTCTNNGWKKVYINGAELDESAYLNSNVKTEAYGGMFTDIVVPEGYVFAMENSRSVSADCRRFGCIPLEKIEGKVTISILAIK